MDIKELKEAVEKVEKVDWTIFKSDPEYFKDKRVTEIEYLETIETIMKLMYSGYRAENEFIVTAVGIDMPTDPMVVVEFVGEWMDWSDFHVDFGSIHRKNELWLCTDLYFM